MSSTTPTLVIRLLNALTLVMQLVSLKASRKWAMTNEETQYFSIDANMRFQDKMGMTTAKERCHSCCLQRYCNFA